MHTIAKKIFLGLGMIAFASLLGSSIYAAEGIGDFSVRFCDAQDASVSEKFIDDLVVSPGDDHELCYSIENTSDTPITISIDFVDGAQDSARPDKVACRTSQTTDQFGQYVTDYDERVTVPANSTKKFKANLNFPITSAGTVLGCISATSSADLDDAALKGGVATIIARAHTIKAYVDQDLDVGLEVIAPENPLGTNLVGGDAMFVSVDADSLYNVAIGFDNIGDLEQTVKVKGSIVDTFGTVIDLGESELVVVPKGQRSLLMTGVSLPWYKLGYTVDLEIVHHANSEFKSEFITDELLSDHVVHVSESFFLFPRWLVIAIAVLIILILIIKKMISGSKKKHQHEVELEEELERLRAGK